MALYASQFGLPGLEKAKAMTAAEEGLHAPHYPWSHSGVLAAYDHARWVALRPALGMMFRSRPLCSLPYPLPQS